MTCNNVTREHFRRSLLNFVAVTIRNAGHILFANDMRRLATFAGIIPTGYMLIVDKLAELEQEQLQQSKGQCSQAIDDVQLNINKKGEDVTGVIDKNGNDDLLNTSIHAQDLSNETPGNDGNVSRSMVAMKSIDDGITRQNIDTTPLEQHIQESKSSKTGQHDTHDSQNDKSNLYHK
ncbi:hypothetical protein I4U23_030837 [Adineta vaga]|nr:hypothetical protein I4U23_030837 [Adineta vaga]